MYISSNMVSATFSQSSYTATGSESRRVVESVIARGGGGGVVPTFIYFIFCTPHAVPGFKSYGSNSFTGSQHANLDEMETFNVIFTKKSKFD